MAIKVTTHQHLLTCHNRVISSWNSSFSFTHLPACGQQDFTSLYCCTSELTQPLQLIIWQLFCFTTPTPKKFKTISNHFSPFSFQPYFLQTTNMNTTSFQSLKYFTQFSQHRSHILCWKRIPNCTSRDFLIIPAQVHSIFFKVQGFLFKVGRYWCWLRGTLGVPPPCIVNIMTYNEAIMLNFNRWMPFLVLTNNQRILETQSFIVIPALTLKPTKDGTQCTCL